MKLLWPTRTPVKTTPVKTTPATPAVRNIRLSPLELPEVLARIFFFLDRHHLLFVVPVVCHGWHAVSLHLLHVVADLDIAADKDKQDVILSVMPRATRLILRSSNLKLQDTPLEIAKLALLLLEKRGYHQDPLSRTVPLRQLVLGKGIGRFQYLASLFPSSTFLTHLKLQNDHEQCCRLDLGHILEAYPNLIALSLTGWARNTYIITEPGSNVLSGTNDLHVARGIPKTLRLRTLILRNVNISLQTLQNLLMATASALKDLYLLSLRTNVEPPNYLFEKDDSPPFDVPAFVGFLFRLGLELLRFTLSIHGEEHSTVLFEQLQQYDVLCHLGGTVQEWGFPIPYTRVLARTLPNRITDLTLVRAQVTGGTMNQFALELHFFLCHSPLLLHLQARGIRFNTMALDFHCWHPPETAVEVYKQRKIWACVGLQTLHLTFCDPQEPWASGQRSLRVAFGYLARVCPRLKEIELGPLSGMDFDLEEGWVILSRLQFLERLQIWPLYRVSRKETMERLWNVVRPASAAIDRAQRRYGLRKWEKRLRQDAEEIQSRGTHGLKIVVVEGLKESTLKPWVDPKYQGSLWDVKLALEDVEKDSGMKEWWPRLEKMRLYFEALNDRGYDERTVECRQPFQYKDKTSIIHIPMSW